MRLPASSSLITQLWNSDAIVPPVYANVTVVLISIRHHHWRWVEREDFLWRHQPYFGFMLVKQLKATIEKVVVLFHILLNPLAVLKPFILNIASIATDAINMNDHINTRIEEQVSFIRNLCLPSIIGVF